MSIIFGQEDYVERLFCYIKKIHPQDKIQIMSFPLNSDNPLNNNFDFSLYDKKLSQINKNNEIFVAFGATYQEKAVNHLTNLKFTNIKIYDSNMDNELKKRFFKIKFTEQGKKFSIINKEKNLTVFMAKSIYDKPLINYPTNLSKHVIPIQVGAALTNKRIAEITDNTGDNISEKNLCFSETTALYWMWKNFNSDYLGLCHYRRLWENLDFIKENLQNDLIDVVLPVPTLCPYSVYKDYMERYIPEVYPTMLKVLKKMSPEYYNASKKIYSEQTFYSCNMLIAKQEILHKLCEWMFPMVFEIENIIGNLKDAYQNRYAGFCTERLITLYFLYNKDNLTITHADKVFIQ